MELVKLITRLIAGIFCLLLASNAFALVNTGALNISTPFTVPVPFDNTGDLYVYAAGSITGDLVGGNSLNIGIDSSYVLSANNFTTNGLIEDIANIQIYAGSSFTANNPISGITNGFVITAGASAVINAAVGGSTGVFNNMGTVTFNAGSAINTAYFVNSGTANIVGATTNTSIVSNTGTMTISNTLSGTGSITNLAGGVLRFAANTDNANSIINNGTFNITGSSTNTGVITNNNIMNVLSTVSGVGTIINAQGGILNLGTNANVSSSITNNSGGTINFNGGTCTGFTNAGTMNLTIATTVSGNIINTGAINLNYALNMAGQTLTNNGAININGSQTITANSIVNPGTLNLTITNITIYDNLTASNVLDLTNGGVVNVVSNYLGNDSTQYTWTVITAATITTDDSTVVNLSPSLIKVWDFNAHPNTLEVLYSRNTFASMANGDLNMRIATTLDNMPAVNGGHINAPLLHAVAGVQSQNEYDAALGQLMPNVNANAHQIAVQNATFNKIEIRMSNLRDTIAPIPAGLPYGDLPSDTALWGGVFGTLANQKPYSKNYGYHANTVGSIIGVDHFTETGDIYGAAFAVSNSTVHEFSNSKFTTGILGYHLILYGSKDIFTDSFFAEWLITGVINKNKGSRYVVINTSNLSVNSSYRTAQGGVRLNLGQSNNNDTWQFSLIETISYAMFYQPEYNEFNSTAALHVTPTKYTNILTVGGGVRMSGMEDGSWMRGNKELRFMGTYDAISTNQATSANFLNSVSDFTLFSAAGRWSFQVGATYTFTFFEHLQLQFSYDFELRTKYTDNAAEIKLRCLF